MTRIRRHMIRDGHYPSLTGHELLILAAILAAFGAPTAVSVPVLVAGAGKWLWTQTADRIHAKWETGRLWRDTTCPDCDAS